MCLCSFSIAGYALTPVEWLTVAVCGLFIGMSKTGINGLGTVVVPFMAIIFGARPSTGVLLPMLCMADLFAVVYYRRSAEWRYIIKLLPWALAGFGLALLTDSFVPARGFKILIGVCIFTGLIVMFWNDRRGKNATVPTAWWFVAVFGITGGFSTMIGNAAGPIMSIFLLAMQLPKKNFVGTAAWFFLVINYLKLPLQYFVWDNITANSLLFNVSMLPFIIIGAYLGIVFVKKVSEKHYRSIVYLLTIVSTLLLFL